MADPAAAATGIGQMPFMSIVAAKQPNIINLPDEVAQLGWRLSTMSQADFEVQMHAPPIAGYAQEARNKVRAFNSAKFWNSSPRPLGITTRTISRPQSSGPRLSFKPIAC